MVGWTKVMVGCVVAGRNWLERVRPSSALIRSGPVAWASRATLEGCDLLGARLCCDIALGFLEAWSEKLALQCHDLS